MAQSNRHCSFFVALPVSSSHCRIAQYPAYHAKKTEGRVDFFFLAVLRTRRRKEYGTLAATGTAPCVPGLDARDNISLAVQPCMCLIFSTDRRASQWIPVICKTPLRHLLFSLGHFRCRKMVFRDQVVSSALGRSARLSPKAATSRQACSAFIGNFLPLLCSAKFPCTSRYYVSISMLLDLRFAKANNRQVYRTTWRWRIFTQGLMSRLTSRLDLCLDLFRMITSCPTIMTSPRMQAHCS